MFRAVFPSGEVLNNLSTDMALLERVEFADTSVFGLDCAQGTLTGHGPRNPRRMHKSDKARQHKHHGDGQICRQRSCDDHIGLNPTV